MRIGLIGAGRMGCTLGKHFSMGGGLTVTGYYSKSINSAMQAAEFTDTKCYEDMRELIEESDAIFLTVPDGQIAVMAMELDRLGDIVADKILCHTSGALSSNVFSGMKNHVYGYSIHPIYAVNSKTESYKNFSDCYVTIEGAERYLGYFMNVFSELGHTVRIISESDKPKYHAAAVCVSNLVVGMYHMGGRLLGECGFSSSDAYAALKPLFLGNAENICRAGCEAALTGPVARCDAETIKGHLDVLTGNDRDIYRLMSSELVDIAESAAVNEIINRQGGMEEQPVEQEIAFIRKKYAELRELL